MGDEPFGRYRLRELLGSGSMGEVWRAHDTQTGRTIALKVLAPAFAEHETFQARFRREAQFAARVHHPHLVPIYDYGEIDGRLYVSMAVVEGHDLKEMLGDGPLPAPRAVHIVEQVALALHAAHRTGLVHRDVKPSNILIDDDDFAYLIDFGIAYAAGEAGLTDPGGLVGTWEYMAPERFGTADPDARTDIYALACVLFEALTGRPPFQGNGIEQMAAAHLRTPPPRASHHQAGVPAALDAVIVTGMAKGPGERYATMKDFAAAARDALTQPPPRPPVGPSRRGPSWMDVETEKTSTSVPAAPSVLPFTGLSRPFGVAISRTGSVYVADEHANKVFVLPPGAITASELPFHGLDRPRGVAVDTRGTVFVADSGNGRVMKLAAGARNAEVPFTGVGHVEGLAVDDGGNLYVAATGRGRVLMLAADETMVIALPFAGLERPSALAVDKSGGVYVTDGGNGRVLKLAAGAATAVALPFAGLDVPCGVAVDRTGTVYTADPLNSRLLRLPVGAAAAIEVAFTARVAPNGVAVDRSGRVCVTDSVRNQVLVL